MSIVGKTYTAYKLFDVTYSGDNYAYTISTSNPFYVSAKSAVLDTYFDFTDTSDATVKTVTVKTAKQDSTTKTLSASDVRDLADALQGYASGTGDASAEATSESVTIPLTEPGYYIVTGSVKANDPGNPNKEIVSAVILDNAAPTASVEPKASVPPFDKNITAVDGSTGNILDLLNNKGKDAVAKVGSVVSYQLDSLVPDLTGYDDYTFIFHDALSEGLTYNENSFALTINGTTENIAPVFAADKKSFTLTIPYNVLNKAAYSKGDAIVLTYQCTVNDSALTYDFENNTAFLEYSRSPYVDETNHTPEKKTYVIDINLDVLKTDNTPAPNTKKLDGAQFKLFRLAADGTTREYYKWDGSDKKVTWVADTQAAPADVFTTNTEGKLDQQIRGLDKGTYYLLETKAPDGYNVLKDPVTVVISVVKTADKEEVVYSATYANEAATMTNGTVDLTEQTHAQKQPVATGTIINQSGVQLPSTGGIGTTIFYVVGGVLVLAAIILLVTKKRMSE